MRKYIDLSLIFFDSPIGRAYLRLIHEENYKLKEIIIIQNSKNKFCPNFLFFKINAYFKNYYALKLIKTNLFKINSKKINNFFLLNENFCKNMYKNIPLKKYFSKVTYINNQSINSKELYNYLEDKNDLFLFTGGGIVKKKLLNTKNKFIHIHPGYLPLVRGADGLLWSILKENHIGVTSFYMNEKIDQGMVIKKEKMNIENFIFKKNHSHLDSKSYYRFIYAFIDPLLRAYHLKKLLLDQNFNVNEKFKNDSPASGNYYSFMSKEKNLLESTIEKLFK